VKTHPVGRRTPAALGRVSGNGATTVIQPSRTSI